MKKTFALVLALCALALPAVSTADPISDHALALASPAVLAQAQLAAPMLQTAHATLAQAAPDPIDAQVDAVLHSVPPPAAGSPWAIVLAVLTIAVPIALNFYRQWRKDKADGELNATYSIARTCFLLTEEAKRLKPGLVPDAAEYAEARFLELFRAQLKKAPSVDQLAIAKSQFKALHGAAKIDSELATAATPPARPITTLPVASPQ